MAQANKACGLRKLNQISVNTASARASGRADETIAIRPCSPAPSLVRTRAHLADARPTCAATATQADIDKSVETAE
jgi:hypothetical protein